MRWRWAWPSLSSVAAAGRRPAMTSSVSLSFCLFSLLIIVILSNGLWLALFTSKRVTPESSVKSVGGSLSSDHSARPNSTQLNSTQLNWFSWVRSDAMITTRDSSQLNWSSCHKFCDSEHLAVCPVELSWVSTSSNDRSAWSNLT